MRVLVSRAGISRRRTVLSVLVVVFRILCAFLPLGVFLSFPMCLVVLEYGKDSKIIASFQ